MASEPTTAVIGSGISGLAAAYLMRRVSRVTLYEADSRLGGHAHTHSIVSTDGSVRHLDTGFIVYNVAHYPLFTRLLHELGVRSVASEMSMSVLCDGCGLKYSAGSGLRTLPQELQSANADLLVEMLEFNRVCEKILATPEDHGVTLHKMLADHGFSDYFAHHVVLPLVSIVWSCDPRTAGLYPVAALLAFLNNHGMLRGSAATRWRTLSSRSADYVSRIATALDEVLTETPVRSVRRDVDGIAVTDAAGGTRRFDRVILAVHPGEALALLADPTPVELSVLGALPYVRNRALLHTDASVLPQAAEHRSSWNYRQNTCHPNPDGMLMSYYLNRLENIDSNTDYVVTLGPEDAVDPRKVLARMDYEHPVYTPESDAARRRLPDLASPTLAYAGAYHGWGFHEDGCRSGVEAARGFGVGW